MELSASCIAVLEGLIDEGPTSPKELSEKIGVPERTVSSALRKLRRAKLVKKIPNLLDMRKPLYIAHPKETEELLKKYEMDTVFRSRPSSYGMR